MLLDDLGTYLQAQGIGTVGTTLFKGSIPQDAPALNVQDALVALIETPGLPPMHVHSVSGPDVEQPTVQVVSRGAPYAYAAARTKAEAAFVALDSVHNQTLGTAFYLWILALQSPFLLRVDDLNRPHIVFNVRCAKALG
jgi:hypothetical protein